MRTKIWAGWKASTFSPSVSDFNPLNDSVVRIVLRVMFCIGFALLVRPVSLLSQGRTAEIPNPSPLPDPKFERVIIAKVGPWDITGAEFQLGYEFGPAFVKREKDFRARYLNYLTYEKLLALEAERRGMDKWPDVQSQVAEIEGDLATEELYRRDVLSSVHITDHQLAVGVANERIHMTIEWLFYPSAAYVDSAVLRMKSGVPFDTLFAEQKKAAVNPGERSMETTKFRFQMKNSVLAGIVDTMKAETISLPVHGPDGWYIVRRSNEWINPVLTQSDETKLLHDVQNALIQHISDSLSDAYVDRVVSSQHPTIVREPLNAIQAYLGNKFLPKEKADAWQLNSRKGANDLKDVSDLKPIASRILVELQSKSLTVGDFLEWYRLREPYVKLELSTPQGFFQSTVDLVWRMVRDRLLTRKAFARGLRKSAIVKSRTRWWKEKMLYTAEKNRIADTITDSLPLVQKYYEDNTRSFVDEKRNVKPFEMVKEDAWRAYYAYELQKRLLHEILRLKQQFIMTIDQSSLDRIPLDEENNPKAIDVYTAKTGGIYPHTAFPSIDYDWQTWE